MVRMDWNRILSIKIESLTDDEIEGLFPMVIRCDIDDIEDVNNLRALMKLSQEILQHKDNQVESLLLECDELKEKVASAHTAPVKSQQKTSESIPSENIEKDYDSKQTDISTNYGYRGTMKTNNEKIKTLLSELEDLEEENDTLKRKLEILKEEMEDATESMDEMTEELEQLRSQNVSYKDKIDYLQNENESLKSQLSELNTVKTERDKMIDDFSVVIEAKQEEWKKILDERDAQIARLNQELSELSTQSVTTLLEHSRAEITRLNEEINEKKDIIIDLEEKLLEAATELNESAALIEKLKNDGKKLNKTGRRREQRELLKKIQLANERIATLQDSIKQAENESTLKSEQLCQVLGELKKYEDKDRGLAETIKEARELKEKLNSKHGHVKELINAINNLELLNSCREMQILSLREKLGIPEDEEISIDGIALKSQEEARLRNDLARKNEVLEHQNFEMKSEVRTLRYKLSKLEQVVSTNGDSVNYSSETDGRSKKVIKYHGIAEEEIASLRFRAELDDFRDEIRILIEENEALRKGMHEILDSIHDQDGKSEVEVRSGTLERLLEALDIRHVSGWYHPAMRIQERLNVVQGRNSELRSQLKQMRRELHKKEALLRKYSTNENVPGEKADLYDSENDEVEAAERKKIRLARQKELDNCERERDSLIQENQEFRDTIEKLTEQLEISHGDLKILESSEDEIKRSFASKSRECIESTLDIMTMKRKCATLENLLNFETSKSYNIRKESIETENALRKLVADMEKRNKLLDNEVGSLRSNLSNSISLVEHNELKDKYEEMSIRLRATSEIDLAVKDIGDTLEGTIDEQWEEVSPKNLETLYDMSRNKLIKCETSVRQLTEVNTELRQQLVDLHKKLSHLTRPKIYSDEEKSEIDGKHEEEIRALKIENENLSRKLEICREEMEMHSTTNSLKIFELDSLRHQILDLHAVSDDKETIARLGFQLNICKTNEIELTKRKVQLENEILHLHEGLQCATKELDETRLQLQDCRKICTTRCRYYEDVIDFLRCQYAGSTSLTALQRFDTMFKKIVADRTEINAKVKEIDELKESAKLHKELLTDRLEIVERLRDILEEQIHSNDVASIMQSFSENSQFTLNDIRLKRRITQLESDIKSLNEKTLEYESTIMTMEYEMINIQRIWYKKPEMTTSASEIQSETKVEQKTVCTQARVENQSKEVQTEPTNFGAKIVVSTSPEVMPVREMESTKSDEPSVSVFREQLDQALTLASERSAILIKYESQIVEYKAKIDALEDQIAEKNAQLPCPVELRSRRNENDGSSLEINDNAAFKSTVNSLRKMLDQKEETIERYQNLLKNDRDEHSNAAELFQRDIKALREEITRLQADAERKKEIPPSSVPSTLRTRGEHVKEFKPDLEAEEKIARLTENISTLEAELNISKELAERWHRLAEERLQHMDHMRERLEEQHKNELESYRLELNKWQTETDTLRQQLSDNRIQLAKGNISFGKELQVRDNKIHELSVAYQQLQSEFEMMETLTLSQPILHSNSSTKMQEMAQAIGRDQANHFQSELDLLKRQIKSQSDKEKMYKDQIADLKQQLSRCYMAKKAEEKRLSNREMQLEKKVKAMEEDLHKARTQLDREYRAQEAKRVKTAEELALWEKQKKWQLIAERTKKELKEKNDEYKKLSANYEKLRAVVSCMEREKWYLRSKLRSESTSMASGIAPSAQDVQQKIVQNLESECQTQRERIKELTERLESEDNRQISQQLEQQKRRIAAMENLNEGNTYVVDQLERLEAAKAHLEKSNIRLESENFELRMEIEKRNLDSPRLREKIEHLEKYIEIFKNEKSSESSPCSLHKNPTEPRKSVSELEKTVFMLKRVVEKLQVENKRLKENTKQKCHGPLKTFGQAETINIENSSSLRKHYELAQKRVVALETDLQLAEQRILMLENAQKEEDNTGETSMLKQQLAHKSELLDKVKQLLTRAAINEKALRQKIQQIELKQTLSTIPECSMILSSNQR